MSWHLTNAFNDHSQFIPSYQFTVQTNLPMQSPLFSNHLYQKVTFFLVLSW